MCSAEMHQGGLCVVKLYPRVLASGMADTLDKAPFFLDDFPINAPTRLDELGQIAPRLLGQPQQYFVGSHGFFCKAPLDFIGHRTKIY